MEFNEFLSLLKKKKQTIFTLMFVVVMIMVIFSLLQTMKYSVKSRLLVVQNTSGNDAYTLSKSNEYLGNLFSEVVYSSSFYDQVMASKYNVDPNYFSGSYSQQIEKWRKTVATKTQGDTGIIEVNVYHPQASEANKIALAVNDVLINNNQNYQGGQNIKVNIIDQPLTSNYPNTPNIFYNIGAAIFGSFILSLFYIYIFPEEKYNIYLFGKSKNKKKLNSDILENYGNAGYKPEEKQAQPGGYRPEYMYPKQTPTDNQNNNQGISGNINNIIGK